MKSKKMIVLVAIAVLILLSFSTACAGSKKDTKKEKSRNRNTEYVEAVFVPDIVTFEITDSDMKTAKSIIKTRLKKLDVDDYEVDINKSRHSITVRFSVDSDSDPEEIIKTISESGMLTFHESEDGSMTADPFMTGEDVDSASSQYNEEYGYVVALKLNTKGADAFYKATGDAAMYGTKISIYYDTRCISCASCNQAISGGEAVIYGNFTEKSAKNLADLINTGALPFPLEIDSVSYDE